MRVGRAQITRAAVNILANSASVPASPFSSTFTSVFPRSCCLYIRRTGFQPVVLDHFKMFLSRMMHLMACTQAVDVGIGVD